MGKDIEQKYIEGEDIVRRIKQQIVKWIQNAWRAGSRTDIFKVKIKTRRAIEDVTT